MVLWKFVHPDSVTILDTNIHTGQAICCRWVRERSESLEDMKLINALFLSEVSVDLKRMTPTRTNTDIIDFWKPNLAQRLERAVAGIWVFFGSFLMFSNFYRLDIRQQNLCCIGKSTIKHQHSLDLKSDLR